MLRLGSRSTRQLSKVDYYLGYGRDDVRSKYGLVVEAYDSGGGEDNRDSGRPAEAKKLRISARPLVGAPSVGGLIAMTRLSPFVASLAEAAETSLDDNMKVLDAVKKASDEFRGAVPQAPGCRTSSDADGSGTVAQASPAAPKQPAAPVAPVAPAEFDAETITPAFFRPTAAVRKRAAYRRLEPLQLRSDR